MTDVAEAILEHAEVLASYAKKLTNDRDTARDLCQDTLFKALANRASLNCGIDVKPWLFTIMRNQFIIGYRRKKLEKKLFSRRSPEMVNYPDASTHACTTAHFELKQVQSIINEMPAILRIPIHLSSQGYKYVEIAAIAKAPVSTIKSRIYVARELLRKKADTDPHRGLAVCY